MVSVTPLIGLLTNNNNTPLHTQISIRTGVGGMRVAFNTALLFFSPLAGALAERLSIRSILLSTTIFRGFMYGGFMPGF
jgi:hypothetical protein